MSEGMKTFYMIWCEGDQAPKVAHHDYPTARAEAERLAKKHPEKNFTIMEAQETIRGAITIVSEQRTKGSDV